MVILMLGAIHLENSTVLPKRPVGRPNAAANARYEEGLQHFCTLITQLREDIGFAPSVRGWCYVLEEHGLGKGEFPQAEYVIRHSRRNGLLPLNIVAEDDARAFEGLEDLDYDDPKKEADYWINYLKRVPERYTPFSFWEHQDVYIQMMVEKIDLKTLFEPVCREFKVPIANTRGWPDLHQIAAAMQRFAEWEAEGKQCVLLYCGDHDVAGLQISEKLIEAMARLANVVGWSPDDLRLNVTTIVMAVLLVGKGPCRCWFAVRQSR
jgi:hypothetical protein